MSSSCGNKCAHRRRSIADQREVQQGTVASVTQGHHTGCIVSLKGTYRSCQWLLESFDLGSLCWLTFGRKSTECGKFKPLRLIATKIGPLRRRQVNICQTIKATLKASKVGHCALWSSWFSCLQLQHKAYPSGGSDRQLLLAKDSKKPSAGSVSQ